MSCKSVASVRIKISKAAAITHSEMVETRWEVQPTDSTRKLSRLGMRDLSYLCPNAENSHLNQLPCKYEIVNSVNMKQVSCAVRGPRLG